MAVTSTNLLQGPATLYWAPFGSAEPTTLATAPAAPWIDLGGTNDGLELEVADEYAQLTVDQLLMAPESRRTSRAVTLKTNLAEATLENFARTINNSQPVTATGTKSLDLDDGVAAFQPTYSAILLDGYAPGGQRRRIVIRKTLQTDSTAHSYKKDDQTLFPATFMAHYVSSSVKAMNITDGVAA